MTKRPFARLSQIRPLSLSWPLIRLHLGAAALLVGVGAGLASEASRLGIFTEDDPQTPANYRLVWSSTPGHRYEVRQSLDLGSWTVVPGYPAVAEGPAQQMPLVADGQVRYFQVRELDEQPPRIISQYPMADGFAVPRFADLALQLADATGVDPGSLRLTVGGLGPFTTADPQLRL